LIPRPILYAVFTSAMCEKGRGKLASA
jgi:hypothetical protein